MSEAARDRADEVYEALLARSGEGNPQPRLDATRAVLDLLGDPQRSFPVVHLTGTNGKTSTARMIESILRAHGLRTGLFTSPHLLRFTERIVVDGEPVTDEGIAENWADIEPYLGMVDESLIAAGDEPLTYFEALTVLAVACFADAPVDVAIVEVGMGGEWDSTNVLDGQVAVLTPIAVDHAERLGREVGEIARTKAGIIKPASTVVTAMQTPAARAPIENAAALSEARLVEEGRDFAVESSLVAVGGQVVTIRGRAARYDDLFVPLLGAHQAQNAALAIAAVESFLGDGRALPRDVLEEGLATVSSPGRLELLARDPAVIADTAHNPAGAAALRAAVTEYFDVDGFGIVFGVLRDKDAAGIVAELAPVAGRWFVTESSSERALPPEDLDDVVRDMGGVSEIAESPAEALHAAMEWASAEPRRAVLITGSITLVAELMAVLDHEAGR